MERHSFVKRLGGFFSGPRLQPLKRKGEKPTMTAQSLRSMTDGHLTRDKFTGAPSKFYRALAENDDVIVAIRSTIRKAIGDMPWKIVPDIDAVKADLKRWQAVVELNLQGIDLDFVPQVLELGFYAKAHGALRDLLRSEHEENDEEGFQNSAKIRAFFDHCIRAHSVVAESHIAKVKDLFEHPEPRSMDSSFRTLMDLLVDDITLFDAGAIVKNPRYDGRGLAEIYTLPGEEIRIYRKNDRSTPIPPNIAYDWQNGNQTRAVYNAAELVYFRGNPQGDGYGLSPIESILNLMFGSKLMDNYVNEFFTSNVPRGFFDLGPNVDQGERDAVEERINQEAAKGLRRIMFVSNMENVKGFIPMPSDSNRDSDITEIQQKWANRKCAVYNLSLNDIGFTEDLHRTTSDTQNEMTQSRGINSFAKIIDEKFNSGIVKGHMWVRDDPANPDCRTGRLVRVFGFNDVRFEHIYEDANDEKKDESDAHISLVKAGIKSINEIRKELGDAAVPGGDIHVVFEGGSGPMKVVDLNKIPAPQDPADQPQPGGGAGPQPPGGPGQKPPGAIPGQPQKALPGGPPIKKRLELFANQLGDLIEGE